MIKRFIICWLIVQLTTFIYSQANPVYPEGIYLSTEDFLSQTPDTTIKFRKLNLNVAPKFAFADTVVDHCLFLDKKNDPIKKVMAISHRGHLYFPEYAIKSLMTEEYSTRGMTNGAEFHRVQLWGRYLYFEVTYIEANPAAAIAMGAMFGMVAGMVAAELTKETLVETPIVYDTELKQFFGLHTRRQLQMFMDERHPEMGFDSKESSLEIDGVRTLFSSLNEKESDE